MCFKKRGAQPLGVSPTVRNRQEVKRAPRDGATCFVKVEIFEVYFKQAKQVYYLTPSVIILTSQVSDQLHTPALR